MANAAQVLARRLFQAGCRHAFGIPGGEVLTAMDALVEAGILCHLEVQDIQPEPDPHPAAIRRLRLLVPGHLNLRATSVLDREVLGVA